MKKLVAFVIGLCIAFNLAWAEEAKPSKVVSVAVLNFEASDELKEMVPNIRSLLDAMLSTKESVMLVERAEIDKLLSEQELGLSGAVNQATAAKIGELTGANVIVTGRVFRVDRELFVVAKIMGVDTSRVFGESVSMPAGESVSKLVTALSDKIAETVVTKADSLLAPAHDEVNVVALLKKVVEGKKLPVVSIAIAEQHVGRVVPDPAAETELKLILGQLGFQLVEPTKNDLKADVLITGQAVSEFGMRKGNLVSVKGRVEISAVQSGTNRVLAADRETRSVIDLSEEIGGKTALQIAASQLALRLVPKLVGQ